VKIVFIILSLQMLTVSVFAKEGNNVTADQLIQKLGLVPLPEEGGFYKETYRSSNEQVSARSFGIPSEGTRVASTAILYLVTPDSFSALHKVASDEIFHFYSGDPVEMIQIDEAGSLKKFVIGSDIMNGQSPQIVVPRGVWQGLRLKKGGKWALMGTTVAPGFEFEDFEIGEQNKLINQFPQHESDIKQFTREP
jgi:predicted cupin superfamily sugar epimerase